MKDLLIFLFLVLNGSYAWAAFVTSTASTALGKLSTTVNSETTSLPTTRSTITVTGASSAMCGTNQVMVGYIVTDSNAAYTNYNATQNVDTDCSGFHFHYDNYTAKLMTNPGGITYQIYCKPINMAFF